MRVLIIHNHYQQKGGEDYVFDAESELLSAHGHIVDRLVFDNQAMLSVSGKLSAVAGLFYNPSSRAQVEAHILSFGPDIIHVHNFWSIASPSVFYAAAHHHIPVVLTLHNYRLICPSATLYYNDHIYEKSIHSLFPLDAIIKGVYRHSIMHTAALAGMVFVNHLTGTWQNRINRYIALTSFARRKFKESALHIPEEKLVVKPNFVKDQGIGKPERDNFFLFVGRLVPEKGIKTLLRAAAAGGFNLTVIGDGPLAADVREASGHSPNITYLGSRDKTEVIETLKKCTAMVCPSEWYEGLPLTVLEAYSTGTPVIASGMESMLDYLDDGVNSLTFEPHNELDLVRRINQLRDNPSLATMLSHNARRTYERNFTPEVNYGLLMNIYEQVLEEERNRLGHETPTAA